MENYFFLKNYGISEGAVSHNVFYHQPLPITRRQVGFILIIILSPLIAGSIFILQVVIFILQNVIFI